MKLPRLLSKLAATLTKRRHITALDERRLLRDAPLIYKGIFGLCAIAIVATSCVVIVRANNTLLVEVPAAGGSLTEGIVGTPRFINPLLAVSNADTSLTSLVYAGLMKPTPGGELVPELAERYSVSDDGTTYTFTLRDNVTFHDGHDVTAEDVAFTIRRAQDPTLKSPQQSNWNGVGVEVVDEKTVRFTLEQRYTPFIHNTTIGILPKHIWQDVSADEFSFSTYNIEPIGAGPYRMNDIKRAESGTPTSFRLTPFGNYALGTPFVSELVVETFPDDEALAGALKDNTVESAPSLAPHRLADLTHPSRRIATAPLPRVFGLFFNRGGNEALGNEAVRRALKQATDKQAIIDTVFAGYAEPLVGPLPPGPFTPRRATTAHASSSISVSQQRAREQLEEAGWTRNEETGIREKDGAPLKITLSTSNTEELKRAAQVVNTQWEAVGVGVDVQFFESTDLKQNIIRPREFDVLLFGQVLGRGFDLYPYWHSSQQSDPGLNIAGFSNVDVDADLEDLRRTEDPDERRDVLANIHTAVTDTTPAIFLFAPHFVYALPDTITNAAIDGARTPADRFMNIHRWYIETEHVWPPFVTQRARRVSRSLSDS